ncbi:hypothetical protein PR202_ga21199 [Eleusine coracana subsp. coracana]|uniref:RNase H type-1 domain-containing protein n=1 Tax=Eleusine coracana subsp. coracana TaxID=191504 RepID=A0AAV5D081_ELECO|nr:hypothetical protein PR202_ga21199 [Eleusine coracana subsp. coracana]
MRRPQETIGTATSSGFLANGFLKINVDVATGKNVNRSAAAAIARDINGDFLGASALVLEGIVDPETVEAIACREGMALASDLALLRRIRLASDCSNVVRSILEQDMGSYGPIIKEIKARRTSFEEVQFVHEGRSSNGEAHTIARSSVLSPMGTHVWEAFTWHDRRLAARAVPDAARAFGFADRSVVWLPSSDPMWKTQRGVVASHLFTPRGLASTRGVREHRVRELVSYFLERAGREVEVGHAVYGGVLNLVSNVICSVDVVDVGADSATGLRKLVEDLVELIATPNVSDLYPFLRSLDLQGWRRFAAKHLEKIFSILDGIVHHRVEEVRSSSSKETQNNDFLDALIELMSTGKMARDNVTSILFDVFTTGSDTIAITVEWAMAELLRNPSIMAKARAEIKGVLGDKETIEEPDAGSLPYLQAVVKEAMRLHPVPPIMLPHKAVEDGVEVSGYAAPQGATVIFNVWAIMRDPVAWEKPDDFMPERFLDRAAQVDFRGKHFEFIPFGSGRRMCPGLPMAERVVPFILASLLHAFEWHLPDGVSAEQLDVTEKFTTANNNTHMAFNFFIQISSVHPDEISGCAVLKGSTMIFNIWEIMRDPSAWERPDEFVPERWFLNGAAEVDWN